jgi:hypothetical protein
MLSVCGQHREVEVHVNKRGGESLIRIKLQSLDLAHYHTHPTQLILLETTLCHTFAEL